MALLTVDDLARDLKVKNEDLLRELATLGYQVEGPDSHLETDDPGALRDILVTALPQREIVEKRIRPTVIRRRMKKQPPAAKEEAPIEVAAFTEPVVEVPAGAEPETPAAEKEGKISEEAVGRPKSEPTRKPKKKVRKMEPARIIEMPPPKPPVETAPLQPRSSPVAAEDMHGEPARAKGEVEVHDALPAPPEATAKAAAEVVGPVDAEAPAVKTAEGKEEKATDDRFAKKRKKKERKMQPAQIIGRIDLRKEPPRQAEATPEPPPTRTPRIVEPAAAAPEPFPLEPIKEEDKRKKRKKDRKGREQVDEVAEEAKSKVRRSKEVVLGTDLYEDRRPGRLRGKGKKVKQRKPEITTPKASKRRLKLPPSVSVASLAHKMSIKASEVIRRLISLGVTASMNEDVDFETASIVATEFGFEAESTEHREQDLLPTRPADDEANLVPRPPVITVMGHVDHGKTSLLDAIRSTHVTDQEAGGITQHIGAYKVRLPRGELVFLDTPGHEAFTAMRARGANVTDFVVLVVAADDGVMDQTREAINHARAAKVPIIVAVNKIDKSDADKDRVVRQLSQLELVPESWGGDTLYSFVSAKTGDGLNDFLELILLQAEMMELRANPAKGAFGTVIEARLDKGKGPVATVLVTDGTLKLGDPFVAGTLFGKVRAMIDHEGKLLTEAGPATPVEVQGFSGVPEAGEPLIVVEDEKVARQIGSQRLEKQRAQEVAVTAPSSLEDLLARMQEQETKELNLILKADVQGSVEALRESLIGISAQEIKVRVIHAGVGAITESDVMLASASNATIVGFNVRPSPKTIHLAEQEKVDLRVYTVIYEVLEEIRKAMQGMLEPVEKEVIMGRAEVRQTFSIPRVGAIAGCYVTSGKIERSNQVRLLRDGVVVYQGRIVSMKRYKDDIKEAPEGYECGLALENFRDVKVGDEIEAFVIEKETAELT